MVTTGILELNICHRNMKADCLQRGDISSGRTYLVSLSSATSSEGMGRGGGVI